VLVYRLSGVVSFRRAASYMLERCFFNRDRLAILRGFIQLRVDIKTVVVLFVYFPFARETKSNKQSLCLQLAVCYDNIGWRPGLVAALEPRRGVVRGTEPQPNTSGSIVHSSE
jgi:hypothetical protein